MRAIRPADLGRGAAALLALLLVVVGLPILLVIVSGNPLPGSLPTIEQVRAALTAPDDGTLLLGALTWIAWIGWAVFTASVVADVVARLRGVAAPRLGPQQRVVTSLVGAAAVIAVAAAALAQPASSEPPAPTARTSVATLQSVVDDAPFPAEREPADVAASVEQAGQAEAEGGWRDNLAPQTGEPVAGEWRDRISTPFGGQR